MPILPFIEDDAVTEVMLNADGKIWCDKVGEGMHCTDIVMPPEDAERIIRLAAAAIHTEINENKPSLAAKLPGWGLRLQASIPPIVEAPVFALRKPSKIVFTLEDYVAQKVMTAEQEDILKQAVQQRKNILVGGGTGSGKTTLANALLHEISKSSDRLYIVEDNPEIQCTAKNKVQILVQPPIYTWHQAIIDALRYRPDRIIVGEVRDGSALDMLKAWNTGHPGGLATIHANSTDAMHDRLCQLIEEVVPKAPSQLIRETINIRVHIARDPKHLAGRKITSVVDSETKIKTTDKGTNIKAA